MNWKRPSRGSAPADRSEAWACVMANLAMPGAGSLAGGRSVGYWQMAVSIIGFIVSIVTGLRLLSSMVSGTAGVAPANGDPLEILSDLWRQIRWPLAGVGLFVIAFVWAGVTSMQLLKAHPKSGGAGG